MRKIMFLIIFLQLLTSFSCTKTELKTSENYKAIEMYSRAIELNQKDAKAYFNRGFAYGRLGDHKQAIKDYDKAIELNPKYHEAYYYRGFAYAGLGKYDQAIKNYDKVIELNPKSAVTYTIANGPIKQSLRMRSGTVTP